MKTIDLEYEGKKYPLLYNGDAMYDIIDVVGEDVIAAICANSREGLEATAVVAAVLMEQGELYRRYKGKSANTTPTSEELRLMLHPRDIGAIKHILIDAILAGTERTVKPAEDDRDVDLEELDAKKTKAPSARAT